MSSRTQTRLHFAAGLISLAASATASAADRTWGGGNLLYTNTSASGWNGSVPLFGDTGTINSGQVNFANHDSFGNAGTTTSAILNLNGGTLASNGFFTTIWNLNLNGGTLLANGGANGSYPAFQLAGTVTVGGSQVSTIDATTAINANNQINIGGNGNSTLGFNVADVTAGSDLIINATLQNNPVSGAGSLTKSGAGTLLLAGTNTYSGGTTLNAGTLALGNSGAIGSSGTITLGGGTLQFSASNTTDYSARFSTAASQAYNIDTNGQNVTLATALTSSGGTLTKSGSGTLTLSNNNSSFAGDLTINGGTILSTASRSGTNSTLGAANVARTIAVNSGGTLQFNSHDTFGNDATTTPVVVVINAGGLVTNNSTYTTLPSLTLNGGELRADGGANGSGYGAYQLRSVTVGGSSASQITTTGAANGLISLGQTGGDIVTFNVADATGNAAADLTISAVLRNSATGSQTSGLAKTGAGTMTLSGANTYTGATLISGGTLKLDATGTINNTSEVSLGTVGTFDVSAKGLGYTVGTLKGSGNVTGALTVSTQLAIGNSPGTTNFSSSLTLGSTSTYLYELTSGASPGLNSADLGDIAGALTINAGAILDLVQLGAYTAGNKFTLFAYDGLLTGTFKDTSSNALSDGATFTDAGGIWMIDYNDATAGANGGVSASNTYVTITAVPEPNAAALLGGLGMLALLRRRR